jgi:hypothetical protein
MSTLKRRLASQANGKLSHGPVTLEGKRNSAANAVHHGMLANSYVLNGEARERFERILDRLDTEFEPETESEQALVDMMAVARWRQMRIWGYERATIAKEIAQLEAAPENDAASNAASRGAEAFQNLADGSRSLDLLNRYESFAYRMFMRSQRQFKAIRAAEVAAQKGEIIDCEANLDIDLSQ